MTDNYEEKQAARKERLLERAEKAEQRAADADRQAKARADHIPMGQPILVGHHSERRHRRDLERIQRGHEKAHEERTKAEELRRRAEAVGRGGISSDDPSAVAKLEAKLSKLEERRERMKALNAAWRKAGKPAPDAAEAWEPVREATGIATEDLHMARFGALRDAPYPAYSLRNLGAEIRRVRSRIDELRDVRDAESREENHGTFTLVEDTEANRVRFIFQDKPSEDVRALLKRSGFRWSRYEGAWQRHLNAAGRAAAQAVVRQLAQEGQQ
jgi:hypothetical protein